RGEPIAAERREARGAAGSRRRRAALLPPAPPAPQDHLELPQDLLQARQLFAVARPVARALRLDRAPERLARPAGEIEGGTIGGTGSSTRGGGDLRRRSCAPEQARQSLLQRLLHHDPVLVGDHDALELGDAPA